MNRKIFIKNCGLVCTGLLAAVSLPSCKSTGYVNGHIVADDLVISETDFMYRNGAETKFRTSLIVKHSMLQFPVLVVRRSAESYQALYMRCTHQGAGLQVFGEKLVCAAHGSEFDHMGFVQSGPATQALRIFPVKREQQKILISLK